MRWEEVVGTNIRQLRKSQGLTQEEVAHGADIDTRYLGGIERGEENPSVAVLGRVAGVLKVHPAALFNSPPAGSPPTRAVARKGQLP